jgi:Peptidase_C39 like family
METRLTVDILPQPDDYTCGPTCLHSVYRYFGDELPLEQVISEVPNLASGGTLDVLLACHALRRGYDATIYTYNVQMFDPTWFGDNPPDLSERLKQQVRYKRSARLLVATDAYLEFLERGGRLRFEDLTTALIRKYLNRSIPVLTGLSATYLHRVAREFGDLQDSDDVRGEPSGHFVVLCGYDRESREVLVADPLLTNPVSGSNQYQVSIDRVICAILLGIVTFDANLLIIQPRRERSQGSYAGPDRRQ